MSSTHRQLEAIDRIIQNQRYQWDNYEQKKKVIAREISQLELIKILWERLLTLSAETGEISTSYEWAFDNEAIPDFSALLALFKKYVDKQKYTVEMFRLKKTNPHEDGWYYEISVTLTVSPRA